MRVWKTEVGLFWWRRQGKLSARRKGWEWSNFGLVKYIYISTTLYIACHPCLRKNLLTNCDEKRLIANTIHCEICGVFSEIQ